MEKRSATIVSFRQIAARSGFVSAASLQVSRELEWDEDSLIPASRLVQCRCLGDSVGGQSLVEALLDENRRAGGYAALVDAANAFDLDSLSGGLETPLLWVRCAQPMQALRALDLLLRDENFTLVLADLRSTGHGWRGVSPRQWYRLQRLCHQRPGRCLMLARESLSPAMDLTLILDEPHRGAALCEERPVIRRQLQNKLRNQLNPSVAIASAVG